MRQTPPPYMATPSMETPSPDTDATLPQSRAPSIDEHLRTQHGLHALASMVMASLPFPPLPIMARRGDGEEGIGSSFDLFNQAIIAMHLAGKHATLTKDELVQSKTALLTKLHLNMSCHYATHLMQAGGKAKAPSTAWVQQAYTIYCNAFREYLLTNYAVSSQDLRFLPLDSVDAKSTIMQHAKSHVTSEFMQTQGADMQDVPCLPTYKKVIEYYAVDLATIPCADPPH